MLLILNDLVATNLNYSKGVLIGQIVGIALSAWLGVGNYIYGVSPEFTRKVLSPDSCSFDNRLFNTSASNIDVHSSISATVTGFGSSVE